MSFITYIATRGSANIEKGAFATAGGFLCLACKYKGTFSTFQLANLIYNDGTPFQISFFLYSLIIVLIVYVGEPFENFWNLIINCKMNKIFLFDSSVSQQIKTAQEEITPIEREFVNLTSITYIIFALLMIKPVVWMYGQNWLPGTEWVLLILLLYISLFFLSWRLIQKWISFSSHMRLVLHGYSKYRSVKNSDELNLARQLYWTELRDKIIQENDNIRDQLLNEHLIFFGQEFKSIYDRNKSLILSSGPELGRFYQSLLPQETPLGLFISYKYTAFYDYYNDQRGKILLEIDKIYKKTELIWPNFIKSLNEFSDIIKGHSRFRDFHFRIIETFLVEIGERKIESTITRENIQNEIRKNYQEYITSHPIHDSEEIFRIISLKKYQGRFNSLIDHLFQLRSLVLEHHKLIESIKTLNKETRENLNEDRQNLKKNPPSIRKIVSKPLNFFRGLNKR